MSRAKQLAACGAVCALLVTGLVSGTVQAQRGAVRIAVGELDGNAAFEGALRDALAREPGVRITSTRRAQLVLRGSVQRIQRRRVGDELRVDCEVSLIVAARDGSIRAMLRGRAGARGSDEAQLTRGALRGAVRGALRPLRTSGPALARN